MTTTIVNKRDIMLDKINFYLSKWGDELVEEMGSYFYFCSKEYCTLPAAEKGPPRP